MIGNSEKVSKMNTISTQDRFRGALVGLAVGDAIGTSAEFMARGSFPPVTDMLGCGPFQLKPGQWTDDTSMALCLAESLIEKNVFDASDQMDRYCRWYKLGYLSSTGRCFDIGITTRNALERYQRTRKPFAGSTDVQSAGNGCLMRLAPVPMAFFGDIEMAEYYSGRSSRTTHGAKECVDASRLFGRMLHRALDGADKSTIMLADANKFRGAKSIQSIAMGNYLHFSRGEIKGSGYVVESLQAALWCFHKTKSYDEAVLMATNLGDDADTTAAICGQLAGAYYGYSCIPKKWKVNISLHDNILEFADALYDNNQANSRASKADYFIDSFEDEHNHLRDTVLAESQQQRTNQFNLCFVDLAPNQVSWSKNSPTTKCLAKMKSPFQYLIFLYLLSIAKSYRLNPLDVPDVYGILSGADMVYSPDILLAASSLWLPSTMDKDEVSPYLEGFENFWQKGIPYLIQLNNEKNALTSKINHQYTEEMLRIKILDRLNSILNGISNSIASRNDIYIFLQICNAKYDYLLMERILKAIIAAAS